MSRDIGIIGDGPEAVILSVLLADAKVPNYLVGGLEPTKTKASASDGLSEARWLLDIHQRSGLIEVLENHRTLSPGMINLYALTDHAGQEGEQSRLRQKARQVAEGLMRGDNVLYTGLCPPSFTSNTLKPVLEKYSGLTLGVDVGLCYLPLLWSEESLDTFREKPKVVSGNGKAALERAQEMLLSIFPSLSVASTYEMAETAGLVGPVYRDIIRALEFELAGLCGAGKVDYASVVELCKRTGLSQIGTASTSIGRDSIGSKILLTSLGNRNRPRLVRTARRINDGTPQQVLSMVKTSLAQCGRGVRRSKIAILGIDMLGQEAETRLEKSEVITALARRGAIIAVYPGDQADRFLQTNAQSPAYNVRVEISLTKAVQKAQCAVIALRPSAQEREGLNAQMLAAEMDRPASVCDLSRVLEASNVERAGLFYASIGRGILGA